MAKAVSTKSKDNLEVRSYVDRLILEKLIELKSVVKVSDIADKLQNYGIGIATIRALLASEPTRFAYTERYWVPSARLESVGKPFAEQLRLYVASYGAPMPLHLLVKELHLIHRDQPQIIEDKIQRVVQKSDLLLMTPNNEVALSEWVFVAYAEPTDRALALNNVSQEEYKEVSNSLQEINWRASDAIQTALSKLSHAPAKLIGAVAWGALSPGNPHDMIVFNWRKFNATLLSTDGYVFGPKEVLHPESETTDWIKTTIKIADTLTPIIEIEDIPPVEVKPDDLEKMVSKIRNSEQTITSTRLLEEFYEITPTVKTFHNDLANLNEILQADQRVVWIGGDRYKVATAIPEIVRTLPEPFYYHVTEALNEENELIDFEISEDGISTSLRKLLLHPLAMDVQDEEIMPSPKMLHDQLRLVLKPIHRELGTFPLCQIPTGWLDAEPNVQELIFTDTHGKELSVWANLQERLLFNLIDWWYEQPIESGAVFTLTKTSKKNHFEFEWMDQPDPVVYITTQRMEQLREIQEESHGKTTFEILKQVLTHWPKGADFLTLFWEVNVVRRSTRRLIASLLSSYLCFYQRSGSPVWHFDSKKVELGVDKTKKKFILKA